MLYQEYSNEIEHLLIQTISAFDDCLINRGKDENGKEKFILPRFIIGSKTRVFADIVNQAGNITLPVCVVEPQSIAFDNTRIFNKQLKQRSYTVLKEDRYKQPTPIILNVTFNFYTKFFNDIWQMAANFQSFANPYIFISWQTPQSEQNNSDEIRSMVKWSGNFALDYPKTANETQNWLIHATANFTIEGWVFNRPSIKYNVITSVKNEITYNTNVSKIGDSGVEYYVKDGWPSLTNIIMDNIRLRNNINNIVSISKGKELILEGRSFFTKQCTGILIKPIDPIDFIPEGLTLVSIDTIKMGETTGFAITEELISITENLITLKFPKSLIPGIIFDIIVFNNAGYCSLQKEKGFYLKIV